MRDLKFGSWRSVLAKFGGWRTSTGRLEPNLPGSGRMQPNFDWLKILLASHGRVEGVGAHQAGLVEDVPLHSLHQLIGIE